MNLDCHEVYHVGVCRIDSSSHQPSNQTYTGYLFMRRQWSCDCGVLGCYALLSVCVKELSSLSQSVCLLLHFLYIVLTWEIQCIDINIPHTVYIHSLFDIHQLEACTY